MKLVKWEFEGLTMPMVEDDSGELYCTTRSICEALGCSDDSLRHVYSRNKEEFDSNCVTDCHAKSFLANHKEEFGLKYIRSDMKLWTEDDMLSFGFLLKTDKARDYRKQLRVFIKQNARINTVTREEHNELKGKFDYLENLVLNALPSVSNTASMAGKMLRSQRDTKHLRLVANN